MAKTLTDKLNLLAEFKFGKQFTQLGEDEQMEIMTVADEMNDTSENFESMNEMLPRLIEIARLVDGNQLRIENFLENQEFFSNRITSETNRLNEVSDNVAGAIRLFVDNIDEFIVTVNQLKAIYDQTYRIENIGQTMSGNIKQAERIVDDLRYYVNELERVVDR